MLSSNSFASIDEEDWKNYLNKSCSPTLTGKAKKILGERGYWVHVNISMESWADSMRIEKPQDYCYIRYQNTSEKTKLMQCLAYIKEQWDWYARCKPIVISACRNAGGFCN